MRPDTIPESSDADWLASSPFQRVSTAMAVHALEVGHPQNDVSAVHHAMQASTDGHERVLLRAWQLAPAWQLSQAWHRLRWLGWGMWLGVVLAILLAAWGMVAAVMGEGARINLMGALFSLLGLNLLMMALWFISLLQSPARAGGSPLMPGGCLQRIAQWLARRMGEPAYRLLTGALGVLGQARGMAWLSGVIAHSAWALGFALILLFMAWGFAFRAYQPVLETTILSPGVVQAMLDALGWLPQLLGLPRPGLDGQAHSAAASSGQWAWWLMACVLGYGLLPRVLLALASVAVLRRRLNAVRLPPDDPGYQRAMARFQQLAVTRVVDQDRSQAPSALSLPQHPATAWAALLHELPGASPDALTRWLQEQASQTDDASRLWRQAPLWLGSSDGSASSLRACVDALAQLPPAPMQTGDGVAAQPARSTRDAGVVRERRPALLMAVNGVASPDRSVARFMRALLAQVHSVQLVLWQDAQRSPDARAAGRARWHTWLEAERLPVELMEKDWT